MTLRGIDATIRYAPVGGGWGKHRVGLVFRCIDRTYPVGIVGIGGWGRLVTSFLALSPEDHSVRMFTGVGSGSLFTAAAAWDSLAADLELSAASFKSVIEGLSASGLWLGPASVAMTAVAGRYLGWLMTTAACAEQLAVNARMGAEVFEAARAATVPPAVVATNRELLMSLVATNVLSQNSPAIAATDAEYGQMWAQNVAAMMRYETEVDALEAAVRPFNPPPSQAPPPVGPETANLFGGESVSATLSSALAGAVSAAVGRARSLGGMMSVPPSWSFCGEDFLG
ncbi:PPE family protein [Mycobacterium haemophilum DSM 44634]|nr:PPE family protein [Mycobacterium haemophilum DSM 44634]